MANCKIDESSLNVLEQDISYVSTSPNARFNINATLTNEEAVAKSDIAHSSGHLGA
jgi:hypothetical protein